MHTRMKKTFISIAIFLCVAIICDILFIRVYDSATRLRNSHEIRNDIYHHGFRACYDGKAKFGHIVYNIRTNNLGFKDRSPRTVSLRPMKERVLLIGDSFTEGIGIEYHNTFVGILNNLVENQNIEILNAAASSYSPAIYYRKVKYLIEDVGLVFDSLICFVDISDIIDETTYCFDGKENVVMVESHDKGTKARRTPFERFKKFLNKNFLTWRFFFMVKKYIMDRSAQSIHTASSERSRWTLDEIMEDRITSGIKKSIENMDKLHNLLEKRRIKMAVVVYPWPDQIAHRDIDSIHMKIWRDWCRKNHVSFVNLFPYFINDVSPTEVFQKYFIRGDVHFNRKGHEHIANILYDNLFKMNPSAVHPPPT